MKKSMIPLIVSVLLWLPTAQAADPANDFGVSYEAIMAGLLRYIPVMKAIPLQDGTPRLVGQSPRSSYALEVFGSRDRPTHVVMSMFISRGMSQVDLFLYPVVFGQLLRNTVSEFHTTAASARWIMDAGTTLKAESKKSPTKSGVFVTSKTVIKEKLGDKIVTLALRDSVLSLSIKKASRPQSKLFSWGAR